MAATTSALPDRKGAVDRSEGYVRVAALEELERQGVVLTRIDRPVAVFLHDGRVFAIDNRCPHMGFPLHRGSLRDGILTCHWHHARFDLCSGCTFDLFADDLPVYDVRVVDGQVFVAPAPRQPAEVERLQKRLREGMEQNLGLVQAKSILGLRRLGVDPREIVRQAALFGARYRDGWSRGMTILTTMANVVPQVSEETAYLVLYQGVTRLAEDCAGQVPRRDRSPLETEGLAPDTLKRWLLQWTAVRHRDAAERTLLTALRNGASREALTDLVFTAATERVYADTGHVVDFCNKAFELLDLIGWEHAPRVLPTVMAQLVAARGAEEVDAWRQPVDLIPLLTEAEEELPRLLRSDSSEPGAAGSPAAPGNGRAGAPDPELSQRLTAVVLGDDPAATVAALREALREGVAPEVVARAVAHAAALRLARFGPANEFGDWITALHTFSYCNAIHQAVKRCPSPGVVRGVFHGALAVYLDRFLNVPPARLPGERDSLSRLPREADTLLARFLEALSERQRPEAATRSVARYLELGHPIGPLLDALALATVREDAEFHTFQVLEAGFRQYQEWEGRPEGHQVLIAVARYLAAHSPTQRAQLQTAQVALRLHRGEALYEEV